MNYEISDINSEITNAPLFLKQGVAVSNGHPPPIIRINIYYNIIPTIPTGRITSGYSLAGIIGWLYTRSCLLPHVYGDHL